MKKHTLSERKKEEEDEKKTLRFFTLTLTYYTVKPQNKRRTQTKISRKSSSKIQYDNKLVSSLF